MEPTGDNNNIFIKRGKDYEGTKGNTFFRGLLAPERAVRYRRAMEEENQQEKDAIAREVKAEMEKRGSRLFKMKKGAWVEVTESSTPSLDSSIKEALRAVTKKRKLSNEFLDTVTQDLPSPPQLTQSYDQTCLAPSAPMDCREVNDDLDASQWYDVLMCLACDNDVPIDDGKQATLCSPGVQTRSPPTGSSRVSYSSRASSVEVASRELRNSPLSKLEESMFNLACLKIHEKEELQMNCKLATCVGAF